MKSRITAKEAGTIVDDFESEYVFICEKIKTAAKQGLRSVEVDEINSYDIRKQLEDDGFELDCRNKGDENPSSERIIYHYIWWR